MLKLIETWCYKKGYCLRSHLRKIATRFDVVAIFLLLDNIIILVQLPYVHNTRFGRRL